jgi:two-component system heavy metal sensor histidine kinase CusS
MSASAGGAQATYGLSARVALSFALLTSLILVGLGSYLNYRMLQTMQAYDQLELNERLDALAARAVQASADAQGDLTRFMAQQTLGRPRMLLWVVIDGSTWVATTSQAPPERTGPSALVDAHGEPLYLVVARRTARLADGRDAELVAAVDHDMPEAFMRRFYIDLALGFIAATGLIGGLGWLIAWRAVGPLRSIAGHAQRIDPVQLQLRLPLAGLPREVAPLVHAFNQALDRVQDGYRSLENFNADIAHELRTPLQNMIGQAQVALSRPRSAEAYQEVLTSLLEEAEQLRRMASDMLFITSAGGARLQREPIDAVQEVAAVLAFFEASAEERGLVLSHAGAVRVEAHRGLLRRALSNLVDNAVKYAAPGSTVTVRTYATESHGCVAVSNEGARILTAQLTHLFDRFSRGESHRPAAGGAGLGLAIVRTIMQLHGGHVDVSSTEAATEFVLRFPRVLADCPDRLQPLDHPSRRQLQPDRDTRAKKERARRSEPS